MSKSTIEWTDFTWNPVTGCTKVSAGCKNCYAETIANRFWKDRKFADVQIHPERLAQPIKLKKPHMVFVNSMSDLFHKKVSNEFIGKVFGIMYVAQHHIYQVLTKRPDRMREIMDFNNETFWEEHNYWANTFYNDYVRNISNQVIYFYDETRETHQNIWLGVSVEDQKTADERIPVLLETRAHIRWLSIEPLLSPIKFDVVQMLHNLNRGGNTIDWAVVGCESGRSRRECKLEWVEDIVEQCKSAFIPVFVKQLQINGKVTKNINDFPEHLRHRDYPVNKLIIK